MPYVARLAEIAAAAFVSSLVLPVGSYSLLYQRFDQVMMRSADAPGGSRVKARGSSDARAAVIESADWS